MTLLGLLASACAAPPVLTSDDRGYLEGLAQAVVEASRIRVGERVAGQGPNTTGCTVLRPGGRDDYPAFWIRDYAMTLECGLVDTAEQGPLIELVATTQPMGSATRTLRSGSRVPPGSVPDHVTLGGRAIFFPGTLDDEAGQGGAAWGMQPPLDDAFFFVAMVHTWVQESGDLTIWNRVIAGAPLHERLWAALRMPPRREGTALVHATESDRGVAFGFTDAVVHTGDLLFASLLAYRADEQFAELATRAAALADGADRERDLARARACRAEATALRTAIATTFALPSGFLRAATGIGGQPDVWGTAFAVWIGALPPEVESRACAALAQAYTEGTIALRGAIRHVPTDADARPDSAWERALVPKNRYQNGAYWSTATGWVAFALAKVDRALAARLLRELVADLRADDFRLGPEHGAPWECLHPDGGHRQNPIYMTSVTLPLAAVHRLDGSAFTTRR